jgi:hypothetical protein
LEQYLEVKGSTFKVQRKDAVAEAVEVKRSYQYKTAFLTDYLAHSEICDALV